MTDAQSYQGPNSSFISHIVTQQSWRKKKSRWSLFDHAASCLLRATFHSTEDRGMQEGWEKMHPESIG